MEIPIGEGQLMMAPKMEARILQALTLKPTDRILEVGTGSGYLTALLASCVATVTSVEYYDVISRNAAANLSRANIHNAILKVGDGAESPAAFTGAGEKFDAIVLTGSVPMLPQAYLDALANDGRLFAVVGDAPVMEAMLYTRTGEKAFSRTEIFETVIAPLIHAKQPSRFEF
jgi:protein-L-isoaspartate(D-aspartate) O-methyltransferase